MDTIARVHELADAQDMTMYRLAQISGISMTTIHMAERRGGQLKIDTIEQICRALGSRSVRSLQIRTRRSEEYGGL